jgi:N4-gp56 family major capsid protein
MAQTNAAQLQGDVLAYLAEEVLPIAQKRLVLHQFGDVKKIPKGRGNTWSATRYNRLPLPFAPLSEGVPAVSQPLQIQQVVGTAQQWGGQVTITDVAELTIFHDPFQQAKRMIGYQIGECFERNDFLVCMGCTQVNYVNSRGARASLVAGDVLDPYTVIRTQLALETLGAPYFGASTAPQIKGSIRDGSGSKASSDPRSNEHFVAVGHMLALGDLRQNATIVNAWSYSDLNRLYNNEAGEWSAIRFCKSNMVPFFVGVANTGINPTAGTAGNLQTGSYFVQLTGVDSQNQYEQRIHQVSSSVSVTGPNGSISITTPNIAGFTFTAYIGTTSSPSNLALSVSGPTTGPMAGQAVQLPANTTLTLTGTGLAQVPPAAPATGVTVYPTFVFGQGAFAVVELENVEYFYLNKAEKADPQNQLRVVAWKAFNGAMILNTQFMARIESASAFTATFG